MSHIEDLLQNLRSRTALLPGSRDRNRRPIIFIPFESQNLNLNAEQLRTVLLYLIEATCENDRQNRFVFVVDMRNGATGSNLKFLLKILEEDLKSFTAIVLVVKPEKFWEKHKASVTSGKYSYDVQTIQLDQLSRVIDVGQIVCEFGGQLSYNHLEWLEIRKMIESISVKIAEILHQFEDSSIKIRNCLLPTNLNGHSPDQFFQNLRSIETNLQSIRSDTLDSAISMLNDRLNQSTNYSQNPDFVNIVPFLKQSANRVNRAKKEVYDLLNSKRRELDRDFQLWTYENEAAHTMKYLVSYADQITRAAYDIGKNEEQAKQLAYEHANLVASINRIEPTYVHVLEQGQRLLDSNASVDMRVERFMRPLREEWTALHRKIENRNTLLDNALKFHINYNLYQKQANDWITSAGSSQPNIMVMSEQELMDGSNELKTFKDQWETLYSETLSCAVDLRKKLEPKNHIDNHPSSELVASAIDSIVRLNKQLNNVWESRNTAIRQRIQRILLLPEIQIVIRWLDDHGEPFLRRKIAIGHDYKSAKSLTENHERFCEIAKQTYQNANKLFKAAEEVVQHGDADVRTINDQVGLLRTRINRFTQKVEARTRLLRLATNFFAYYAEIMEHYSGHLEQRNKQIRLIAASQKFAEQNKEVFQLDNERCEQAFEAIMTKANQLLEELEEQKRLLDVRNSDTIENVRILINTIEEKHLKEKSRWQTQREILKHAAYVSEFLQECKVIYNQILDWNNELRALPDQLLQQNLRVTNIAQYHNRNMVNVEEAVRDAMRRTNKIKDSIAGMNLVMQNNEPAIDAVTKMGQKLQDLENNVMKIARKISDHFQWKQVVDKVEQESEDLNKKISILAETLRSIPCLAFNSVEVEEQLPQYEDLKQQIAIHKELIITFEKKVNGHEKEFISIDLMQQLKYHLELVKVSFAHLTQLLENRQKLHRAASQYYKCLATAIPAMESVGRTYNYDTSEKCETEQNEELSKRLESIRNQLLAHRSHKHKFMQGLNYAIRCADQFNIRLRRMEEELLHTNDRLMHERCQLLQQQVTACCEDIRNRQNFLVQKWTKRNEKMLVCEKSCLLEVLAKQISDYFDVKTAELQQKLPQKQLSTMSSAEVEAFMEIVLSFERSYKTELKKISQLKERLQDFWEHIRHSYHFKFVETAVKQVEEQSKKFEELLRNYHQKCAMTLGKTNADILSRNAKLNRQSDGSLEERISQQSRESNDFTVQDESAKKLREPMRELLNTEKDYINDLQKCIEVYLRAYRMSEHSAPVSIQRKEQELFGNIDVLYQFHANQFLNALKTYEQNPELVYCCFDMYAEKLKDLYTDYILNNVENNLIFDATDVKQYFEAIRVRYKLEQNHSLQSMLIKPIQRITRYPLLLNQLMEYSTENRKDLQRALDKVIAITREANDRVHLKNFEEADNFRIGDFIMQDSFVVTESKRYFNREKERQVFLFESNIIFAKKIQLMSKPQPSSHVSTASLKKEELLPKKLKYICKYRYLLSDIHIVEHLEGDPTKFGLRKGSLPNGDNTTILKASSEEIRKLWVMKIRELILEMPIKAQTLDSESNGSTLSFYNHSIDSIRKLSLNENPRLSALPAEPNAVKQTNSKTNGDGVFLEMRRPKQLVEINSDEITLSNDNFLLPLDENHYENLMPELSAETPTTSANCKRSTVSSTASSDIDLPPAMDQLPPIPGTEHPKQCSE